MVSRLHINIFLSCFFALVSNSAISEHGSVSAFGIPSLLTKAYCGNGNRPTTFFKQLQVTQFFAGTNGDDVVDKHDDTVDNDTEWLNAELVDDAEFYETAEEEDWMSDRERAKLKREASRIYQQAASAASTGAATTESDPTTNQNTERKGTRYTPEEEELINAMGGKFKNAPTKRQPGYLGDCTLEEIATDYSIPICYLADVLCMWGVPVPINTKDRLGDLVTGEQAFALLEAIYSLDVATLHDRYSNMNLLAVCDWHDIDLKDAFEMAVKEGWSLPFGVQTCLRVEQEDELVRVYGSIV